MINVIIPTTIPNDKDIKLSIGFNIPVQCIIDDPIVEPIPT